MNLFKRRTKPAAAVITSAAPVDPEPVVESPTEPENMQVSMILDAESIVTLIQQLFDFNQRTTEKLYTWASVFACEVSKSKSGLFDQKDCFNQEIYMNEQYEKNKYAWEKYEKLKAFYLKNQNAESFKIEWLGGNV